VACHASGAGFSETTIVLGPASGEDPFGVLAPHSSCASCHAANPHGVGISTVPVLREKMLNTSADSVIASDIANGVNGVTTATFDGSPETRELGLSLGTGYLCTGCHSTGAAPMSFSVKEPGATPGHVGGHPSITTGHRVEATSTTTWNEDGSFGAEYEGATDGPGDSRIAYRDVSTCRGCHDARSSSGVWAFPHGYLDAGNPAIGVATVSDPQASYLWMRSAADADEAGELVTRGGVAKPSLRDGTCLKCHRSADGSSGVGLTY
jgi:hypothetical protein